MKGMAPKIFLFLTYTPISDFTDEDTIINLQLLKSKMKNYHGLIVL